MGWPTRIEEVFERGHGGDLYDLAPLYDLVYRRSFDYDAQARRVRDAVRASGGQADGDRVGVLELACGTGALAERLARTVEYLGVDASAAMLAVARRNVDRGFVRGDARRLPLDWQSDVVAMLGCSASHFGGDELSAVATEASQHLDDGAFLLDAHDREALQDGYTSEDVYDADRWSIRYRGESHATGGGWCVHDYGFDVTDAETGKSRTFEGRYELRFWGRGELEALLAEAGYDDVGIEATDGVVRATALRA